MPLRQVWQKVPEQIRYTARPETRELQNTQSAWTSEQWNLKNWQNLPKKKEIDLCIVGMDDPLVGGLVDVLEDAGIRTFGPKKNAAILEGSKAFSKDLMKNTIFLRQDMRILQIQRKQSPILRMQSSLSY